MRSRQDWLRCRPRYSVSPMPSVEVCVGIMPFANMHMPGVSSDGCMMQGCQWDMMYFARARNFEVRML